MSVTRGVPQRSQAERSSDRAELDKLREYKHFCFQDSTDEELGDLVAVTFDTRGGWGARTHQLFQLTLWYMRRYVRSVSCAIWRYTRVALQLTLTQRALARPQGLCSNESNAEDHISPSPGGG